MAKSSIFAAINLTKKVKFERY